MSDAPRWFSCPRHYEDEIPEFFTAYLKDTSRKALLIAAAGFDPRCLKFPGILSEALDCDFKCLLVREFRKYDDPALIAAANENIQKLQGLLDVEIREIAIFTDDNHVNAGKGVVELLQGYDFSGFTDVFLDASSMSVGASFPIAGFLWMLAQDGGIQFHMLVASARDGEARVDVEFADQPVIPKGFSGNGGLVSVEGSAILWLPELAVGLSDPLGRIHGQVNPKQTCPILPFPTDHLQEADKLMFEYADHFRDAWSVDERDIVYASGNDPHDLYRSLCRVNTDRRAIFGESSQMVISPFGSKALAVGALMAAMDQDIRVSYLEAVRYSCSDLGQLEKEKQFLSHIWLTK